MKVSLVFYSLLESGNVLFSIQLGAQDTMTHAVMSVLTIVRFNLRDRSGHIPRPQAFLVGASMASVMQ